MTHLRVIGLSSPFERGPGWRDLSDAEFWRLFLLERCDYHRMAERFGVLPITVERRVARLRSEP